MLIFILLAGCSPHNGEKTAVSASFPHERQLSYHGITYVADPDEKITEVERKIGSIKKYTDEETKADKENSSSWYKEGTSLYKIKNVEIENGIAVEEKRGLFVKAVPIALYKK
ncbi:hypothetical protein LRR81_12785 [Metabacillus sp. GX 13764]|uniref:hypothetical protein n=1 Tax=Metabacillus kandeliae TaxID=2900151 RepID=UPI001E4F19F5|nr:hypothetical protein [Metabacillus kandeliae]MCD7035115.1 hypothetical protein [Metabacillus kandeliae]